MRNLKKVLALVLAVAMIASMGLVASAVTYSDVAANANYADAVNLLSNLGIIKGYDDGTFKPDNAVTRAEAATMIVRMLGLDDEVEQGDSIFTDVKAADWFSGYVNVAVANGIVNGMGNNTFNPNGEVTYEQIVKMIVCALGYEPVAEAKSGDHWSDGYLLAASSKYADFLKGANGTVGKAASRALVAKLIYNALEVELMDQTSFSTGIYGDTFKVLENKTILSEYLGLEKVDGVIIETYLSKNAYDADEDKTATLVVTKNYTTVDKDETPDFVVGSAEQYVVEGLDVASLLGYTVVAYLGESEDGVATMYAVAPKAGRNNVKEMDVSLITSMDAAEIVYSKSETSTSTTTAEIDNTIKNYDEEVSNFVVNGFNANYDLDSADVLSDIADDENGKLETITLLDNDNDGDFEFVFATMPSEENSKEFVVEAVEADDYYVEGYNVAGTEDMVIDLEATDVLYTILKDGKEVDFDAIAEGDVITVLDDSAKVITVYVSSKTVEDEIEEKYSDGTFKINGEDYALSTINGSYTVADASDSFNPGHEAKWFINYFGDIAYEETLNKVSAADYVYVIDTHESTGDFDDTEYLVKVITEAGAVEVLTIKSTKVDFYGDKELEDADADEVFAEIDGYEGLAMIKTSAAGEINVIYLPGADDDFAEQGSFDKDDDAYSYNEARGRYGKVYLNSNILVFHMDTKKYAKDKEEGITVSKLGNIFVDESSYTFTAYGEAKDEINVMVVEDAKASLSAEAPFMVVTSKSTVTVDDEKTVKLTGYVNGEKVTVVVDPTDIDDESKDAEDLVKGNVIIFTQGAEYVSNVKLVLATTKDTVVTDVEDLDDLDIVVNDFEEDKVSIYVETADEINSGVLTVASEKEYWFADNYTFTTVDYRTATTTIRAGKTSDLKDTLKTKVTLLIKTVADSEDEISDIVAFIEAE